VRLAIIVVMLLPTAAGCRKQAKSPARTTITFWQPWGSDLKAALEQIVAEFERAHPDIDVEMSFAANNLTSSQKLFLAIAGGCAPDVTLVDGQQLAEWAARGALTDISDYVKEAGLTGDDFWLPRWKESTFAGRVYALPWGADPNFAMLWNKKMFREAGLDPDRPPRTVEELDEYARKLTKFDEKGKLLRVGFIPWDWDGDNSTFTWGYAFGGDFYQMPAEGSISFVGRVTANDPRIVKALQWMQTHSRTHDVRLTSAFQSNKRAFANNPFIQEEMAIRLFHVSEITWLHRYAPTIEYGIAPVPAPPDGEYPTGWIGGWSMGIPRGANASKQTFEFIRWMCVSPQATMMLGKLMNQMPACRKSPYFETIKDDKDMAVYYAILKNSRHVRTLMPVQGYLMELLKRAVNAVLYEDQDPKRVLDEVTAKAQQRLEQVMSRVELRLKSLPQRQEGK
jgi:ABC-type glycerol-3-phosphate transport system substrate-binding protein